MIDPNNLYAPLPRGYSINDQGIPTWRGQEIRRESAAPGSKIAAWWAGQPTPNTTPDPVSMPNGSTEFNQTTAMIAGQNSAAKNPHRTQDTFFGNLEEQSTASWMQTNKAYGQFAERQAQGRSKAAQNAMAQVINPFLQAHANEGWGANLVTNNGETSINMWRETGGGQSGDERWATPIHALPAPGSNGGYNLYIGGIQMGVPLDNEERKNGLRAHSPEVQSRTFNDLFSSGSDPRRQMASDNPNDDNITERGVYANPLMLNAMGTGLQARIANMYTQPKGTIIDAFHKGPDQVLNPGDTHKYHQDAIDKLKDGEHLLLTNPANLLGNDLIQRKQGGHFVDQVSIAGATGYAPIYDANGQQTGWTGSEGGNAAKELKRLQNAGMQNQVNVGSRPGEIAENWHESTFGTALDPDQRHTGYKTGFIDATFGLPVGNGQSLRNTQTEAGSLVGWQYDQKRWDAPDEAGAQSTIDKLNEMSGYGYSAGQKFNVGGVDRNLHGSWDNVAPIGARYDQDTHEIVLDTIRYMDRGNSTLENKEQGKGLSARANLAAMFGVDSGLADADIVQNFNGSVNQHVESFWAARSQGEIDAIMNEHLAGFGGLDSQAKYLEQNGMAGRMQGGSLKIGQWDSAASTFMGKVFADTVVPKIYREGELNTRMNAANYDEFVTGQQTIEGASQRDIALRWGGLDYSTPVEFGGQTFKPTRLTGYRMRQSGDKGKANLEMQMAVAQFTDIPADMNPFSSSKNAEQSRSRQLLNASMVNADPDAIQAQGEVSNPANATDEQRSTYLDVYNTKKAELGEGEHNEVEAQLAGAQAVFGDNMIQMAGKTFASPKSMASVSTADDEGGEATALTSRYARIMHDTISGGEVKNEDVNALAGAQDRLAATSGVRHGALAGKSDSVKPLTATGSHQIPANAMVMSRDSIINMELARAKEQGANLGENPREAISQMIASREAAGESATTAYARREPAPNQTKPMHTLNVFTPGQAKEMFGSEVTPTDDMMVVNHLLAAAKEGDEDGDPFSVTSTSNWTSGEVRSMSANTESQVIRDAHEADKSSGELSDMIEKLHGQKNGGSASEVADMIRSKTSGSHTGSELADASLQVQERKSAMGQLFNWYRNFTASAQPLGLDDDQMKNLGAIVGRVYQRPLDVKASSAGVERLQKVAQGNLVSGYSGDKGLVGRSVHGNLRSKNGVNDKAVGGKQNLRAFATETIRGLIQASAEGAELTPEMAHGAIVPGNLSPEGKQSVADLIMQGRVGEDESDVAATSIEKLIRGETGQEYAETNAPGVAFMAPAATKARDMGDRFGGSGADAGNAIMGRLDEIGSRAKSWKSILSKNPMTLGGLGRAMRNVGKKVLSGPGNGPVEDFFNAIGMGDAKTIGASQKRHEDEIGSAVANARPRTSNRGAIKNARPVEGPPMQTAEAAHAAAQIAAAPPPQSVEGFLSQYISGPQTVDELMQGVVEPSPVASAPDYSFEKPYDQMRDRFKPQSIPEPAFLGRPESAEQDQRDRFRASQQDMETESGSGPIGSPDAPGVADMSQEELDSFARNEGIDTEVQQEAVKNHQTASGRSHDAARGSMGGGRKRGGGRRSGAGSSRMPGGVFKFDKNGALLTAQSGQGLSDDHIARLGELEGILGNRPDEELEILHGKSQSDGLTYDEAKRAKQLDKGTREYSRIVNRALANPGQSIEARDIAQAHADFTDTGIGRAHEFIKDSSEIGELRQAYGERNAQGKHEAPADMRRGELTEGLGHVDALKKSLGGLNEVMENLDKTSGKLTKTQTKQVENTEALYNKLVNRRDEAMQDPTAPGNAAFLKRFAGQQGAFDDIENKLFAANGPQLSRRAAAAGAGAGDYAPENEAPSETFQDKLSIFMRNGRTGRSQRRALAASGDIGDEGSPERAGWEILGGAARVGNNVMAGHRFFRNLSQDLVQPFMQDADAYKQYEQQRIQGLASAGTTNFRDLIGSDQYKSAVQLSNLQQGFQIGTGRAASQAWSPLLKGVMGSGVGTDNSFTQAASVLGPAVAAGGAAAFLTGNPLAGLAVGGAAATIGAAGYISSAEGDTNHMSRLQEKLLTAVHSGSGANIGLTALGDIGGTAALFLHNRAPGAALDLAKYGKTTKAMNAGEFNASDTFDPDVELAAQQNFLADHSSDFGSFSAEDQTSAYSIVSRSYGNSISSDFRDKLMKNAMAAKVAGVDTGQLTAMIAQSRGGNAFDPKSLKYQNALTEVLTTGTIDQQNAALSVGQQQAATTQTQLLNGMKMSDIWGYGVRLAAGDTLGVAQDMQTDTTQAQMSSVFGAFSNNGAWRTTANSLKSDPNKLQIYNNRANSAGEFRQYLQTAWGMNQQTAEGLAATTQAQNTGVNANLLDKAQNYLARTTWAGEDVSSTDKQKQFAADAGWVAKQYAQNIDPEQIGRSMAGIDRSVLYGTDAELKKYDVRASNDLKSIDDQVAAGILTPAQGIEKKQQLQSTAGRAANFNQLAADVGTGIRKNAWNFEGMRDADVSAYGNALGAYGAGAAATGGTMDMSKSALWTQVEMRTAQLKGTTDPTQRDALDKQIGALGARQNFAGQMYSRSVAYGGTQQQYQAMDAALAGFGTDQAGMDQAAQMQAVWSGDAMANARYADQNPNWKYRTVQTGKHGGTIGMSAMYDEVTSQDVSNMQDANAKRGGTYLRAYQAQSLGAGASSQAQSLNDLTNVSDGDLMGSQVQRQTRLHDINIGLQQYDINLSNKQMYRGFSQVTGQGLGQYAAGFEGKGQWYFEDQSRGLQRSQEDYGYQTQGQQLGIQQAQMNLGNQQFNQTWDFNKSRMQYNQAYQGQSMTIQRSHQQQESSWGLEDINYQKNMSAVNFGFSMIDADENVRYSTGRARRDAMRHRDEATVTHSMEVGQMDKEESRAKDRIQWATDEYNRQKQNYDQNVIWDREALQRDKTYHDQNLTLQKQQFDLSVQEYNKQREFLLQNRQLEDQQRTLQRTIYTEEMKETIQSKIIHDNAAQATTRLNDSLTLTNTFTGELSTSMDALARSMQLFMQQQQQQQSSIAGRNISQPVGSLDMSTAQGQSIYNQSFSDAGYADGGSTGIGAHNEPAGIVHKNEWVVPENGALVIRGADPETSRVLGEILAELKGIHSDGGNAVIHVNTRDPQAAVRQGMSLLNQAYGG